MDNLANAPIQKNATIDNLVATNAALSKAIQDIQCTLTTMMTNQTPTPGTPALPGRPTGERTQPTHWATVKPPWDRTRYCWTHGFKVKVCHTSSTCTSCKAGHQPGATRANTMKGNIFNAGWPTAPPTPPNWQVAPADLQQIEVVNKTILAISINYKSSCTNPTDLESIAFTNTTASVTLLTNKAPTSSTTNTNVHITVLQPSDAKMTSTHAVDLLLKKLPTDARLAYQLPCLINNLLSVTVLCNAGCEVFLHKHGCEVTLNGETIPRWWRDPKNQLWHVKIVDNGWTTKLTIHDNAMRPPIPLMITPTSIAMATPTPDKGTEQANSLYKCSNMHQLMNYYYTRLNYPIPSSLVQAINCGYLKGWCGLTSQRAGRHITGSPKSSMGHIDQVWKGTHSMQPQTPTSATIPTSGLPHMPNLHISNYMVNAPQEPHNARTHIVFMYAHAIKGITSSNQTGWFPITSN